VPMMYWQSLGDTRWFTTIHDRL